MNAIFFLPFYRLLICNKCNSCIGISLTNVSFPPSFRICAGRRQALQTRQVSRLTLVILTWLPTDPFELQQISEQNGNHLRVQTRRSLFHRRSKRKQTLVRQWIHICQESSIGGQDLLDLLEEGKSNTRETTTLQINNGTIFHAVWK